MTAHRVTCEATYTLSANMQWGGLASGFECMFKRCRAEAGCSVNGFSAEFARASILHDLRGL